MSSSGKRNLVSYGKESTYGTAVSRTVRVSKNAKVDVSIREQLVPIHGLGTDDYTIDREYGKQNVGAIFSLTPQNWELLLFGIGASTNTGSSPTTHSFSRNTDNSLPSFTLESADQSSTDIVHVLEGCQVNDFTISWDGSAIGNDRGAFVNLSMNLFAERDVTGTSTTSLAGESGAGFLGGNVTFTLNDSDIVNAINGSLNYKNGLSEGHYAYYDSGNSHQKKESFIQTVECFGDLVLHYTDSTEFDLGNTRAHVGDQITSGTASSGGNTTLVDSGAGWTVDLYADKVVRVTSGLGKGQVRVIDSNTSDTLTVKLAWVTNPDSTSVFEIVKANKVRFNRGTNDYLDVWLLDLDIEVTSKPVNLEGLNELSLSWVAKDLYFEAVDSDSGYLT